MPATTRSQRSNDDSNGARSSVGSSARRKGGLFVPSPSKRKEDEDAEWRAEQVKEEQAVEQLPAPAASGSSPSSSSVKVSPSRQTTLYSLKLGPGGRLRRAEGKAAATETQGKRRKIEETEAVEQKSEVTRAPTLDDDGSLEQKPSSLIRKRSPSPIPRHPSDFHQVTSPTFLANSYTPFPGCHYISSFLPSPSSTKDSLMSNSSTLSRWYDSLATLPNWHQPTLKLYGRSIVQQRPIAAFSKVPDLKLRYSGQEARMDPWPPVLEEMEDLVRDKVGREVRFNHAFLNLYEDGKVNIGKHSDNLENRVIVTLSLGAPRKWIMTRRHPPGAMAAAKRSGTKLPAPEVRSWTLENGSLLVMQGDVQKEWYHEVPKEGRIKEGRISVTFRQLVYD